MARCGASLEEEYRRRPSRRWPHLGSSGISIDAVTAKLVEEGVQLFADAFDKLLDAVARKRRAFLDEALDSQRAKLSPALEDAIGRRTVPLRRHDRCNLAWSAWGAWEAISFADWREMGTDASSSIRSLRPSRRSWARERSAPLVSSILWPTRNASGGVGDAAGGRDHREGGY